MRGLTAVSRRWFGQGLGAVLTLAATGKLTSANDSADVTEVRMSGFAFEPDRLDIVAGDTVTWINEDLSPHTATSVDGAWDTGSIEFGREARQTFNSPGVFQYECAFHPHMIGSVVVRAKDNA